MLHAGFLSAATSAPGATAFAVGEAHWTYGEQLDTALRVAAAIRDRVEGVTRVAVVAQRGFAAATGLLASSFLGATYVPVNPTLPPERLRDRLDRARPDVVLADPVSCGLAAGVYDLPPLDFARAAAGVPMDLGDVARHTERPAYLLFTSGSTGEPKGVPIASSCIAAFTSTLTARYGFRPDDRFAQLVEPTFDVSLIATLGAWAAGGCVDVLDNRELVLAPARVLDRRGISVWTSVPSTANLLRRRGALTPGAFTGLRLSMFCGEPLVTATADAWAAAAPRSLVVNLYGPTEVTVAALAYDWLPGGAGDPPVNGVVPIGSPLPGVQTLVVDPVTGARANEGELCLGGVQTFTGYLGDVARTRDAFVDGPDGTPYYRTGDRVRRLGSGCHVFLGRLDDQVKILGHRVELGEIEDALRNVPGVVDAAAVAWPVVDATAQGVVAFVVGPVEASAATRQLADRLPAYAVPSRVVAVDELPMTPNGKVDRGELRDRLQGVMAR